MKPLFILCAILTLSYACTCNISSKRINGNGNLQSVERQVDDANKIKLYGSIDVVLDSGAARVRVEADENLLKYIITDVDNGWLVIKTKRGVNIKSDNPIRVFVTTPTLSAIKIAGSGNVVSEKKFWSKEQISLDIAGSGNINIDVNTPKVDSDIMGSGNVNITGETRDVDVSIAGSGNFKGTDLKAENAKVKIAGSGDAFVFADVKLDAKIAGSGNIKYKGNATVDKKIAGSGTIGQQQ